jgi:hypothetical protein
MQIAQGLLKRPGSGVRHPASVFAFPGEDLNFLMVKLWNGDGDVITDLGDGVEFISSQPNVSSHGFEVIEDGFDVVNAEFSAGFPEGCLERVGLFGVLVKQIPRIGLEQNPVAIDVLCSQKSV